MNADAILRDLIAFSVQVALIASVACVCVAVLKVHPRARYAFLRLALLACIAMPWLIGASGTAVETADRTGTVRFVAVSAPGVQPVTSTSAVPATVPPPPPVPAFPSAAAILAVIALGIGLRALWLVAGVTRLRRLVRRSVPIDSPDFEGIQQELGTSARIAQAAGLAQPVTFGFRRPIVLLPEALTGASSSLQRAVVTHELFHVRRGDWLSVIGEEVLRTILWFHPEVFWLTSRIQLAREEIVDELCVRATGDRRTYIQALLAFADTPGLSAAPAFAHRRHLFHRIVSVSKENVMTARRAVASTIVVVAVLFGTGWHAGAAFPVAAAARLNAFSFETASRSEPPTERVTHQPSIEPAISVTAGAFRLAQAPTAQRAGQVAKPGQVAAQPVTPENPIPRRIRGASPVWPSQVTGNPSSVVVSSRVTIDRDGAVVDVAHDTCNVLPANSNRTCATFLEATAAAIRQWRYERPAQGPLAFYVTVSFRRGSESDVTQAGASWTQYVRETQDSLRVLAEETGGLAIVRQEDFLRYLEEQQRRLQGAAEVRSAEATTQPAVSAQMLFEQLEQLAAERRLAQSSSANRSLVAPSGRPVYRNDAPGLTLPRPLKRLPVAYTQEAMAARVEGVIVIQAIVDEQGLVADPKVVRSLPLLDEAALANVRQWVFSPGVMNGEPVPVLVQIELEFHLR